MYSSVRREGLLVRVGGSTGCSRLGAYRSGPASGAAVAGAGGMFRVMEMIELNCRFRCSLMGGMRGVDELPCFLRVRSYCR